MKKIYKNVIAAIVISVSLIFGIQFLSEGKINLSVITDVSLLVFLKLLLVLLGVYILNAFRLWMMLRLFSYNMGFFKSLENVFFGAFFTFITPMSVGGQPYQIYHLASNKVKTEDATNIIISKTLEISIVVLFLDILFIKRVLKIISGTLSLTVIITGFLAGLGISLIIFIGFVNKKILRNILLFFAKLLKKKSNNFENKVETWIDNLHKSITILWKKNTWIIVIDLFLYFLTILLNNLILYQIIINFGKEKIDYWSLLGIFTMMNTVAYYIPTPGSSGGIEGIYQIVLSKLLGPSNAINIITIFRLITFYIPITLGSILFWKFGMPPNFAGENSHE
ncbi:flippase-like domain-containing protein [Thermosipho ferrireducens]|uniref:Flippase-like domain-containing protein n=1 Tax=Thermosipho ferrireducens TaxID=2571116 RepID=A0ABX7S847_9BACT|nr:lysylphosphatidylglycerol synthase transmembrane domain-containing protein [Thermosipho ferrireducens]QTA37975.1 flippase-like domain-containing protein [Thermosipho ferrireducens]